MEIVDIVLGEYSNVILSVFLRIAGIPERLICASADFPKFICKRLDICSHQKNHICLGKSEYHNRFFSRLPYVGHLFFYKIFLH